jgi:signal transduction histidine kinase
MQDYHKLLVGQIDGALGAGDSIPDNVRVLLQEISRTYESFDQTLSQLKTEVGLRTQQLMASTSNAYLFLDSLNIGLVLCDVKPEVVLTNKSMRQLLASKAAVTNEHTKWDMASIDDLLHPELELKKLVAQSLATNQALELKEVGFGKNVSRVLIAPMVNEATDGSMQQIGAVILAEDITEQKILERSKDEFLSIASHELRTPLTAIRGNAALLKKYYSPKITDKNMTEMVDDIYSSSVRLIKIVNDFLDVSALEQGKILITPELFSLAAVAQDVAHEMQSLCAAKGVELRIDPAMAEAPSVVADKQRAKQVIYNLVGNALKFTEKGSITIRALYDNNFVYTAVTDTGRGMSPENQRLLFRKFQQAASSLLTRDTTQGTGLGLYISKLIVEHSGGQIWLDYSAAGKGSTFAFSLPRPHADKPAA